MDKDKLYNYYDMLREFYYEKNGLELTIEFLEYMLQELKSLKGVKGMNRIEYLKRKQEVCPLDKEELYELQKGEDNE